MDVLKFPKLPYAYSVTIPDFTSAFILCRYRCCLGDMDVYHENRGLTGLTPEVRCLNEAIGTVLSALNKFPQMTGTL